MAPKDTSVENDFRLRLRLRRKHPNQAKLIDYLEEAVDSGLRLSDTAILLMAEGYQARLVRGAETGVIKEGDVPDVSPLVTRRMQGQVRKKVGGGSTQGKEVLGNAREQLVPKIAEHDQAGLQGLSDQVAVTFADHVLVEVPADPPPALELPSKPEFEPVAMSKPPGDPVPSFVPASSDEEKFLGLFDFSLPAVESST